MAAPEAELCGQHLSQEGVVQAIRALTLAEKTMLMKIAMMYARKTPFGHDDLIQESILRVLDGRRPWPNGLGAVPFLAGVARSIAWDWKRESVEEPPSGNDTHKEERNTIATIDAMKLLDLFNDDPIARTIVEAMLEGGRGEELQQLSGLDKTGYESKRVKIRRRIEKHFSPVWKS
jgi:DNA-directed RNA polymerase specialized sigma24 family protein